MSKALDTLRYLVEATSLATGQAFFDALVVNLPRAVGGTHALVGELSGPAQRQTQTLAVSWNGTLGQNFVYDLEGTPCEATLTKGELAYYPSGVADQFPRDRALRRLGVEAYMGTPLRGAKGAYLGMLVVLHDRALDETTEPESILRIFADRAAAELERLNHEEKLRQLQLKMFQAQKFEALGRFAGALVHDFNNLLAAISGGCELMLLEDEPLALRQAIADVMATSDRGTQLVRRLLAFAKRQPTEAHLVIAKDVLEGLRPIVQQILGKSIQSQMDWGGEELRLFIDPAQLEQALVNLLVNARDAVGKNGIVQLRADLTELDLEDAQLLGLANPGRYVRIMVADNGCGMSPDTRSRACEPFFTTKGPDEGSGLGLASCHGIVTQAGGALLIESEPELGTTIKLFFPLYEGDPSNETQLPS